MFWLEISPHDAGGRVPHGRESSSALAAQALTDCDFHILTAVNRQRLGVFCQGAVWLVCWLGVNRCARGCAFGAAARRDRLPAMPPICRSQPDQSWTILAISRLFAQIHQAGVREVHRKIPVFLNQFREAWNSSTAYRTARPTTRGSTPREFCRRT